MRTGGDEVATGATVIDARDEPNELFVVDEIIVRFDADEENNGEDDGGMCWDDVDKDDMIDAVWGTLTPFGTFVILRLIGTGAGEVADPPNVPPSGDCGIIIGGDVDRDDIDIDEGDPDDETFGDDGGIPFIDDDDGDGVEGVGELRGICFVVKERGTEFPMMVSGFIDFDICCWWIWCGWFDGLGGVCSVVIVDNDVGIDTWGDIARVVRPDCAYKKKQDHFLYFFCDERKHDEFTILPDPEPDGDGTVVALESELDELYLVALPRADDRVSLKLSGNKKANILLKYDK